MGDIFYVLPLGGGNRLALNLFEVMGIEECMSAVEEQKDAVGNTVTTYATQAKFKRKILRIYLRNGAAFNVEDPDRELLDRIQNHLKGYGPGQMENADA